MHMAAGQQSQQQHSGACGTLAVQHVPCNLSQLHSTLKHPAASCLLLLLVVAGFFVRQLGPSCRSSTLPLHWLGWPWAVHPGGLSAAAPPSPHSKPPASLRDKRCNQHLSSGGEAASHAHRCSHAGHLGSTVAVGFVLHPCTCTV